MRDLGDTSVFPVDLSSTRRDMEYVPLFSGQPS
jgi:hypothetical protein